MKEEEKRVAYCQKKAGLVCFALGETRKDKQQQQQQQQQQQGQTAQSSQRLEQC